MHSVEQCLKEAEVQNNWIGREFVQRNLDVTLHITKGKPFESTNSINKIFESKQEK